jgi:hypothetical protein
MKKKIKVVVPAIPLQTRRYFLNFKQLHFALSNSKLTKRERKHQKKVYAEAYTINMDIE